MKKLLTIFSILVVAVSCNESELSHGKIEGLALIRAEISIYQSLRSKKENQVVVCLFDEKGKKIRNDSLKIYVNGAALKYTIQKELYYTTTTYFLKNDVAPRDNKFLFEIELADTTKLFLAETDALGLVNPRNIIYSEKGDLNKDFEVKWKDLEGVDYMIVEKSVKLKKKDEDNVTYYEGEASDTIKINPIGNHVISKSTFDNALNQISTLSLKFVAENYGTVNPSLVKGSYIIIHGNIEERVWFE